VDDEDKDEDNEISRSEDTINESTSPSQLITFYNPIVFVVVGQDQFTIIR